MARSSSPQLDVAPSEAPINFLENMWCLGSEILRQDNHWGIQICLYICTYVCKYINTCKYVYMYKGISVYMYMNMFMYMNMSMYTYP